MSKSKNKRLELTKMSLEMIRWCNANGYSVTIGATPMGAKTEALKKVMQKKEAESIENVIVSGCKDEVDFAYIKAREIMGFAKGYGMEPEVVLKLVSAFIEEGKDSFQFNNVVIGETVNKPLREKDLLEVAQKYKEKIENEEYERFKNRENAVKQKS